MNCQRIKPVLVPWLDPQSKSDWEIEKINRQVADLDIDLAKKRGELVSSDDVQQWVADAVHDALMRLHREPWSKEDRS